MGLFFHGFLQFGQNLEKTTPPPEKKRFRPMGRVWGEAWQGTWVWTFFFFFFGFFGFPCFFAFFHVKMLSSQYLSKNVRFYYLHTCAPHEYPFCISIYRLILANICMYTKRFKVWALARPHISVRLHSKVWYTNVSVIWYMHTCEDIHASQEVLSVRTRKCTDRCELHSLGSYTRVFMIQLYLRIYVYKQEVLNLSTCKGTNICEFVRSVRLAYGSRTKN